MYERNDEDWIEFERAYMNHRHEGVVMRDGSITRRFMTKAQAMKVYGGDFGLRGQEMVMGIDPATGCDHDIEKTTVLEDMTTDLF